MEFMFLGTTHFNQNISGWNVSKVNNMTQMFQLATNFNQDLNSWNVSKITTVPTQFADSSGFASYKPNWPYFNQIIIRDRSQLIDYINQIDTYGEYRKFPINNWDVTRVEDMKIYLKQQIRQIILTIILVVGMSVKLPI